MRAIFMSAFFAGAAVASLPGERDLSHYTYEDYLGEFDKNGAANDLSRRSAFAANLKAIREHNADPSKTWFMTVNAFTDLTTEEFKASHLGGMPELDDSFFVGEHAASNIENLPDSLDWRTKTGVVTPVKNQGSCGSCWAFSTVETLESHYAIATGEAAPHLSAQQITSCTPNPQHCGGTGGCGGNIQTQGFNYTAQAGISGESDWPYTGQTGTCDQSKIKPCAQNDGFVKVKVNDYAAHMDAVVNKGPVAISLAAASLQSYGGGVLSRCDCDMDHAVQLVGYGTDSGNDYWLVRNSWGGSWGEKGYVRIKRFGDGKEPTCVDKTPQDGEACAGDTNPRTYAGLCGLLGSSSYPTGMKKTGDCPKPPPSCPFSDCNGCATWCAGSGYNCGTGGLVGLSCKCGSGKSCTGEGVVV